MKYIFFVEEQVRVPYAALRQEQWRKLQLPSYAVEVLQFASAWCQSEAHFTLYSSGTTGSPKPLLLHRSQLEASAGMGMDFFRIPVALPLLLCLSVRHIAGIMQVVRALSYGHSLHVLQVKRRALQGLQAGRRYGLVSVVPLQLHEASKNGYLSRLEQCHTVLVGGAPLFPSTEKELASLQTYIYHSYGMSETAAHVALRRLHTPTRPYFEAMSGVHLSRSEAGCLEIKSPTTQYRSIHTRDLVEMQGRGRFIWLGRADTVINSGGIKLHLDELDRQICDLWLQAHGTAEASSCFAFGVPDEALGERLVWFVEQAPSQEVQTRFVSSLQTLPSHHAPKSLHIVSPFVLTASGKIDKRATAQQSFREIKLQHSQKNTDKI